MGTLHLPLLFLSLLQIATDTLPGSGELPQVSYRLSAALEDSTGSVAGSGEIRYRHLGPGSLASLSLLLGRTTLRSLRVDGEPIAVSRAERSDDGIVRISLPRPLAPGDSVVLTTDWTALLPVGERRRMDLVRWYPLVMDATSGTTVPIPALATALLRLDLPADHVIGGTGVPLCGDPGWERAAVSPGMRVKLQRDWYTSPRDPLASQARCDGAEPGRKLVTWYAEDVTELAFATSPTFRYEEGDFLERPVRALYQPGQERTWGAGLATRRTETALAWVLDLGGRYPWPQITVVEGGGGHALPMVVLAHASGQAALLHLLGRMMTEQVLLGGDRVFTLGTAAFQTAWFFETLGRRGDYARLEREILDWDFDGLAVRDEPLHQPTPVASCRSTACRRTEFMSHQLRRWGGDDAMRRLYATLYNRFRLRPIPPGTFQGMARELIAPPPDPLYRQLPRGGILYDDAVASARRDSLDDGRWRTTVIVERRAAGVFPQTVWVVAESDTGVGRAAALTPSETLSVVTRTRPRRVLLDPLVESHDWNMLNNQHAFGFRPAWLMLAPQRPVDGYLDTWFTRKTARNRLTVGWAPAAWYSDAGGWTFGTRVRQDYLGRFELNQLWASVNRTGLHGRLSVRNPVGLRVVGWSESVELAWEEGRAAAGLEVTRRFRNRLADTSLRALALGLHWLTVTDATYPDPRFYDDAGTVELALTGRMGSLQASLATGHAYPNSGADIAGGIYGRVILSAALRRPVRRRLMAGVRLFAGATIADDSVPRQRRIPLAGAGAYERFASPLLRSRGSILARPGVFYHEPGGLGLRGLDPRVSSRHALGGSFELDYAVVDRAPGRLLGRVAVAAFADAGFADGDLDPGRDRLVAVADAGIGLRSDHRLGRTSFQIRFDLPLWVSRPALAQDGGPEHPIGFRWSFSFLPSF